MKRLHGIVAALLLLVASPAYPWSLVGTIGTQGGGGGGGMSCTDADLACEAFGDATDGYDQTWAEYIATGGAIDPKFANSGTFHCDTNSTYSVKITKGSGTNTYITHDWPSTQGSAYISAYIKVVSEGLADGQHLGIVGMSAATAVVSWHVRLYQQTGGSLYFQLRHKQITTGSELTDLSTNTISLDTWYHIEGYWNSGEASGGVTWKIDGTSQSVADSSTYSESGAYTIVGNKESTNSATGVIQVDAIKTNFGSAPVCN